MARRGKHRPGSMNRTTLHPIEVLALATMTLVRAVLTLARMVLVPLAALVLVLVGWRPASPQPPTTPPSPAAPPAPAEHPLARLAEQLEALPAATLRNLAGTPSKRYRKAELIAMVASCG